VWEAAKAPRDGIKNAAKNVHDTVERIADGRPFTAKTRLDEIVPKLGVHLIHAAGLRLRADLGNEEGVDGKPQAPTITTWRRGGSTRISRYRCQGGHWRAIVTRGANKDGLRGSQS
jgi:hypothetical protein